MARNLRRGDAACKRSAARPSIELLHAVTSSYVAQRTMIASCLRITLAALLLALLADSALGDAAAGARPVHLPPAARRQDRMLHPGRAGESRQPEGPGSPAQGRGAQGQAAARARSGDLSRRRPRRFAAGRLDRRRRPAGRRRLVERHRRRAPPPRRHHHQPTRRGRLDAQSRLLRGAQLGAGACPAPRRDRAAGARDPAALPRRLRQAQDRSLDVRARRAGRRRRRPREGDAARAR